MNQDNTKKTPENDENSYELQETLLGEETPEAEHKKKYQIVGYTENLPFEFHNITREDILSDTGQQKNVLEHWHREIEIVYTFVGNAVHYIDGKQHIAAPGRLFIVNSQSIHKIISDIDIGDQVNIVAVVLRVNDVFVENIVRDYLDKNFREMYFMTEVHSDTEEAGRLMQEFSLYADKDGRLAACEKLKLMGMMYHLMYLLCRDALKPREVVYPINTEKNMERLRGVMLFVGEHYTEPIQQREVAERFHFTREYFCRFFHKNTGMTFKEYLTRVRVRSAEKEITGTEKNMLEIAMSCGFSDSRGLILAFKKIYGITPYQYRKECGSRTAG